VAIKRSKVSFAVTVRGVPKVINAGHLVEDGDPLLKGREHLFEDVETHLSDRSASVEQATAAPGEKRTVTRGRPPGRKPREAKTSTTAPSTAKDKDPGEKS